MSLSDQENLQRRHPLGPPSSSPAPKRFFPSAWAAFATGCLVPLVVENLIYLQGQGVSDLIVLPIAIVGIQLPMAVATFDFDYGRRRGKRFAWFRFAIPTRRDFEELYFPAWGRVAIWFLGAVVSVLARSGYLFLRP